MFLPDSFKSDILSKNTKIEPLIVIEKRSSIDGGSYHLRQQTISSTGVTVDGIYFKPILLSFPTIRNSVDLDNFRIKTSSVTVELSDAKHGGESLSDILQRQEYHLINADVTIYYKSPSCTDFSHSSIDVGPFGCPRVYEGKVKAVQESKDKITLSIEDVFSSNLELELPYWKVGTENDVPDKWKNKPYPMLYGELKNAPTIGKLSSGSFTLYPDRYDINNISTSTVLEHAIGFSTSSAWQLGTISMHDGNNFVPLLKYAQIGFGNEEDKTLYDLSVVNPKQYDINTDNMTVQFLSTSLFHAQERVQGLSYSSPSAISLKRNVLEQILASTDYQTFYQDSELEGEMLTELDYKAIVSETDTIYKIVPTTYDFSNDNGGGELADAGLLAVLFSLQWDSGTQNTAFLKVIQNQINGIRIPTKGDANTPAGLGVWEDGRRWIYITDYPGALEGDTHGYSAAGDTTFLPTSQGNQGLGGSSYSDFYPILMSFWDDDDGQYFPQSNTTINFSYSDTSFMNVSRTLDVADGHNTPDVWPLVRLSQGEDAIPACGEGWSSFEILGQNWASGVQNLTGNANLEHIKAECEFVFNLSLQSIKVLTVADYDDVYNLDYFMNAQGRVNLNLLNYSHENVSASYYPSPYLINPADIMRDIIDKELDVSHNTGFVDEEFEDAWHESYINNARLDFSVTENIKAKDLLSKIGASSFCVPRLAPNGRVGFVHRKRRYETESHLNAHQINNIDVIDYEFFLSSSANIISKSRVRYGKDYGQNKLLKETSKINMTTTQMFDAGVDDVNENYVIFDSDYIQDDNTAGHLNSMRYHKNKVSSLSVRLELPFSYIGMDVGEIIRFRRNDLLGGKPAYGIDYTNVVDYQHTMRYPIFQITDITKSKNRVTVKAEQLHALMGSADYDPLGFGFNHFDQWENYMDGEEYLIEEEIFDDADSYTIQNYEKIPTGTAIPFGASGTFTLGETTFGPSYIRRFLPTGLNQPNTMLGTGEFGDSDYGWGFTDYHLTLEHLIQLYLQPSSFGLSSWDELIPEANADGSGYGSILNGQGKDKVGYFTAIRIRFYSGNPSPGADEELSQGQLLLRNIKDSEMDSDVYNLDETPIPFTSPALTASETEIKLGWVFYLPAYSIGMVDTEYGMENWFEWNVAWNNPNLNQIPFLWSWNKSTNYVHPYVPNAPSGGAYGGTGWESVGSDIAAWSIDLYPYVNPLPDLIINYTPPANGGFHIYTPWIFQQGLTEWGSGDWNQDGEVNVLDVAGQVAYILNNAGLPAGWASFEAGDLNGDGYLNVLDTVQLVWNILNP